MVQSQSLTRFDGADVVPLMSADEARQCVAAINEHMNGARMELLRLYEGRGWVKLGYASWRKCVVSEFSASQATLYRQLEAAEIERRISHYENMGQIPETQLRPLAGLTPIEQPAAWQRAHEIAEGSDERFTARHVEQAVQEQLTPNTDVLDDIEDVLDPPMEPAQAFDIAAAHHAHERRAHTMRVMGSSESPEWYTPQHVIDRVITVLGEIDLDPCSNSREAPNVPALNHYTAVDNGLEREWFGKVYMNPPYGDEIPPWINHLVQAYENGLIDTAIALVPGRIDTAWFRPLWNYELCVVYGRLRFSGAENSAPFPSVIVYLGPDVELFRETFSDIGRCGKLQ